MAETSGQRIFVTAENVIYEFSSKNKPCLTVKPGQEIVFQTLDCFSGQIKSNGDKFERIGWDKINPATGPVFIEGAAPGDVLSVDILDIQVEDPGVMISVPNMGAVGHFFSESQTRMIPIRNGLAHLPGGYMFEVDPMIGVIGVAPSMGSVPCGTPGVHGGNMDTRVIRKDSTVYLPVQAPGALLAMGDLHALMGDGEILICGVEVSGKVTVKTHLLKDRHLPFPCVETEHAFYTIWSEESLDLCAKNLLDKTCMWLSELKSMSLLEISMLLSAKGSLQISQIVDPLKTCRMEIPKILLKNGSFCR